VKALAPVVTFCVSKRRIGCLESVLSTFLKQ
jgi:hypothetical protein